MDQGDFDAFPAQNRPTSLQNKILGELIPGYVMSCVTEQLKYSNSLCNDFGTDGTDRQTERQKDRQMDRQMGGRAREHARQTERHNRRISGW